MDNATVKENGSLKGFNFSNYDTILRIAINTFSIANLSRYPILLEVHRIISMI
jgi:hypothetical protein